MWAERTNFSLQVLTEHPRSARQRSRSWGQETGSRARQVTALGKVIYLGPTQRGHRVGRACHLPAHN